MFTETWNSESRVTCLTACLLKHSELMWRLWPLPLVHLRCAHHPHSLQSPIATCLVDLHSWFMLEVCSLLCTEVYNGIREIIWLYDGNRSSRRSFVDKSKFDLYSRPQHVQFYYDLRSVRSTSCKCLLACYRGYTFLCPDIQNWYMHIMFPYHTLQYVLWTHTAYIKVPKTQGSARSTDDWPDLFSSAARQPKTGRVPPWCCTRALKQNTRSTRWWYHCASANSQPGLFTAVRCEKEPILEREPQRQRMAARIMKSRTSGGRMQNYEEDDVDRSVINYIVQGTGQQFHTEKSKLWVRAQIK